MGLWVIWLIWFMSGNFIFRIHPGVKIMKEESIMALGHMGREFVGTLVFRSIQNGGWKKALRIVKKAGWRKFYENPERGLEGIFKEYPEREGEENLRSIQKGMVEKI